MCAPRPDRSVVVMDHIQQLIARERISESHQAAATTRLLREARVRQPHVRRQIALTLRRFTTAQVTPRPATRATPTVSRRFGRRA